MLGVFAAFAGIGFAGTLVEARAFVVRRQALSVLAPGSRSLRVLHISDVHLMPYQRAKQAWVGRLGNLDPDLVVCTGDNLGHARAVPALLECFTGLFRYPGVFVLGSNDYYGPRLKNPARYLLPEGGRRKIKGRPLPTADLVRGFTDAGWLDLSNRRTRLDLPGANLEFVGVDDPHLRRDRYARVAGPAATDAALTIGVSHAPYRRVLDAMTADGAGLILAGHTHGGQLCLPGVGALVTNCDLPRSQAKGLSRWYVPQEHRAAARHGTWLHVSAGIGTSPFTPVRFWCRPEVTLLTLHPRSAD